MTTLRPGSITPGFIAHASPEAIAWHLAEARKAEIAWSRHCARLSALLDERLAQVRAGTWPPPKTAPTEES